MSGWFSTISETLGPWKEVIASAFGALAAAGAVVSGILKQRSRPDATFSDPPAGARGSHAGAARLHPDDLDVISGVRSCIGDLREAVEDLTRVTRLNSKATEDNTEAVGDNTGALNRRGGGGGRR